jgi:Protein of unknown function (DUF2971)
MNDNSNHRAVTDHPLWLGWMEEGVRADLRRYGVPLRLHHYTSWAGFTAIISSRTLRATDTRFVNDPAELIHGLGVCAAGLAHIEHPELRPHAELIYRGLEQGFGYTTLIACLSDAEDLESQWTRYADSGRGFAIGFDVTCLSDLWAAPALRVLPVEYDERVQAERVYEAVQRATSHLNAIDPTQYPDMQYNLRARFSLLGVELAYLCATFKSEDWSSEREWRLVYHRGEPNSLPIETRLGGDGRDIPFVTLDLTRTIHGPRRMVESVRIGSRVHAECARQARLLLAGEQPPVIWTTHPHDAVPDRQTIVRVGRG